MCIPKRFSPEVEKTLKRSGEVSYIGKRLDDESIKKDRALSDLIECRGHFEYVSKGLYDNLDELTNETKDALREFASVTLEEIKGIISKHFPNL